MPRGTQSPFMVGTGTGAWKTSERHLLNAQRRQAFPFLGRRVTFILQRDAHERIADQGGVGYWERQKTGGLVYRGRTGAARLRAGDSLSHFGRRGRTGSQFFPRARRSGNDLVGGFDGRERW